MHPEPTNDAGDKGSSAVRFDGNSGLKPVDTQTHIAELSVDAHDATVREHDLGFMEAIKLYPKAVGWSILLSTAVVMEGYDVLLLSSFYALPQFNEKYGVNTASGYEISASWKSGLSNGALCGEILGLFLCGFISERLGYRKTMLLALWMIVGFIFILFFAPNIQTLLVGEILCGIPWGIFQTLTTAYASEVCPLALRAYLCTYVNLCWVIGQFIASGVLRAVLSRTDEWAYRIPFAIQWMWPVPLIIGVIFAPESPWWLVRQGRLEEAKHALRRLTLREKTTESYIDAQVAMIEHTNEVEKQLSAGTSYLDCFKGVNLRRTEIACIVWFIQCCCGASFMGFSTYFYIQAGLPTVDAFDLSLGQYGLGMVGTISSWFFMARMGRRTLYLYGGIVLFSLLLAVGFASLSSTTGAQWAVGSLLLVFTLAYDITIGPVCYSLVAEMSSTRLKGKTIVLARNLYNIGSIVVNILTTYQLTPKPGGWGWSSKSAFFWAGSCFLCVVWIFFRLPEPKGRTYGELDLLFERRVSARQFKSTKVDIFGAEPQEPNDLGETEKISVAMVEKV